MKLQIKFGILIGLCILLISFIFHNNIDYSKIKYSKFDEYKKKNIPFRFINCYEKIKNEKFDDKYFIKIKTPPDDEGWLLQKYSKNNLYNGTGKYNEKLYIGDKEIFTWADGFIIGENNNTINIFKDKFGNILALTHVYIIKAYNPNLEKRSDLLDLEIKLHSPDDIDIYRLLDVKGEWLLVLGIYHDSSYEEVGNLHNHFKIYKYNLKTKEVRILDSRDYNLTMYIDTYYLNYDLSKDRRYIYMSFMYGYSGYDGEKETVSEGGVYIFDWWEERLYKIFEPMPVNYFKKIARQKMKPDGSIYYEIDVKVVNNTDDGYVYAMWAGTNEDYQYVRFKNPEEMLKKH